MATVKYYIDENTGKPKVVLKDGKVSCSCCGCCMYPSAGLFDGRYTFQDLPDEVIMYRTPAPGQSLEGPTTVPKLNAPTALGVYYGIQVPDPPPPNPPLDPPQYEPAISTSEFAEEWTTTYGQIDPSRGCLIYSLEADDPERQLYIAEEFPGVFVYDNFANNYSISGPISATVTRSSACTWSAQGLSLRYNSDLCKFQVNGNTKSGFQNTPVGSYAGGYTVS